MINPSKAMQAMDAPKLVGEWVQGANIWREACDFLVLPHGYQAYPFTPAVNWAVEASALHPGLYEEYQSM